MLITKRQSYFWGDLFGVSPSNSKIGLMKNGWDGRFYRACEGHVESTWSQRGVNVESTWSYDALRERRKEGTFLHDCGTESHGYDKF